MKDKFISLLALMGIARSVAESKAETGKLEETDLDALTQAVKERDELKTKLEASLASELKLQGELASAKEELATTKATLTTTEQAKTKAEGDLKIAQDALAGKGGNPRKDKTDPQGSDGADDFSTSYDKEKADMKAFI